jgi:hypothetical protein
MKNSFEHKNGFPSFCRLLVYFLIISIIGLLTYFFAGDHDKPDQVQINSYELVRDHSGASAIE